MATIKDVARLAGVSVATVSRVLNGSAAVSAPRRGRVQKAAARLNYSPNVAARSLITNQTHTIGVLLPDLFGEFFSEVIRGIDHAARQAQLHLLLSSSHADSEELIAALRAMRGRIDGLIVRVRDIAAPRALGRASVDYPLVMIDPGLGARSCDSRSRATSASPRVTRRRCACSRSSARPARCSPRTTTWRSARSAR